MAQWMFKTPPEEMTEEELLDALIDCPAPDIDCILAVLEEKFPLPFDIPSADQLLNDFYEKLNQTPENFSTS